MTAKIQRALGDRSCRVIKAGPWYIRVCRSTRRCHATSGDYWFEITRQEAAWLILGKSG